MAPAGFEPAIPAGDRPYTRALDRSATGTGSFIYYFMKMHGKKTRKTCVY